MQVVKYKARARRAIGALAAATVSAVAAVVLLMAPAPASASSRYEPVQAEIPVSFTVSGDKAEAAPSFTARIAAVEGEAVQPDQNEIKVAGAGKATFTVPLDEVGEHHYTVTQSTLDTNNWTLDTQVYDVTVYCMWEESTDSLFTKVIVNDSEGFKANGCAFANSYKAPSAPAGTSTPGWMPQTGDVTAAVVVGVCVAGVLLLAAGVALRRRGKHGEL